MPTKRWIAKIDEKQRRWLKKDRASKQTNERKTIENETEEWKMSWHSQNQMKIKYQHTENIEAVKSENE